MRLYFLWLPMVDISLARVANRVMLGGHFVPDEDVRRRFARGIRNLFHLYRTEVDAWILIENTRRAPCIIAFEDQGRLQVIEPTRFALAQETGNVTP